jgi:cell division septum initiation protein DivIVA
MLARPGRLTLSALLAAAVLLPSGCHRMTEEEALESARDEVRQEMQPEFDRRRREIEDLKRQIEVTRARLAAQRNAGTGAARTP